MAGRARPILNVVQRLKSRGCVADTTNAQELNAYLAQPRTFYAGFDPTADSLHVGHLSILMTMRRLQELHHKPIVLIGGATGKIGDPSGRDSERPLISTEQIESNVLSITTQIKKFLDFSSELSCRAEAVNNIDWYRQMNILTFLRDVGKHFKISTMLSRDSVTSRLSSQSGLTLTEFTYQSLQAYDFLTLSQRHDCLVQIGGTDQWGNIISGVNLIRDRSSRQAHGMTVPLLTSKSGVKLGKSTGGGSLWLCPKKTSPYSLYQYLLTTDDSQVYTLLKTLSPLSFEEIDSFGIRVAQTKLAESVTELVHGREALEQARSSTERLFHDSKFDFDQPLEGVPELCISTTEFLKHDLSSLLQAAGIVTSRTEGRRLVMAGGVRLNGRRESDPRRMLGLEDLQGAACLLQIGKKRRHMIRTGSNTSYNRHVSQRESTTPSCNNAGSD